MSLENGSGPAVTLGLFDWVDADGVREAGQLYRERLDLLAEAESRGFDIYHLAEHHGTPLGLVPSPSVFLAAAAVRTTRIRLCPLVYVYKQFTAVWRRHGDDRFAGRQDFGRAIDEGRVIAGSPATVRTRLTGMIRASGCNHFVGAFAFGSLSYPEARSSLTRFTEEVAPALRGLAPD